MKKIIIGTNLVFLFIFFIACLAAFVSYSGYSFTLSSTEYYATSANYSWPLPEYHTISSYFGPRTSPTTGASSYHSGIDIPAPEGTPIYSVTSGTVTYLGFERSKWVYIKNHIQYRKYNYFVFTCLTKFYCPNWRIYKSISINQ